MYVMRRSEVSVQFVGPFENDYLATAWALKNCSSEWYLSETNYVSTTPPEATPGVCQIYFQMLEQGVYLETVGLMIIQHSDNLAKLIVNEQDGSNKDEMTQGLSDLCDFYNYALRNYDLNS